jgi:hypothetical protein
MATPAAQGVVSPIYPWFGFPTVELTRQLEYRQGKPLQIHDLLAELRRYIEVRPKLQDG